MIAPEGIVTGLLTPEDAPAVRVAHPGARGRFVLVGDHAGSAIPLQLGTLGLDAHERARHIAVDIGIAALGPRLSAMLDATFVSQHYSRLVIDCNRRLTDIDSIVETSDGTQVPGNQALSADARAARVAAIHAPYHAAIAQCLSARVAAGLPTVMVALHSFTPRMAAAKGGAARPWHIGVLHDAGDNRFARALLAELHALPDWCIGDNEPYAMDKIDYTIPHHAYAAALPYAEIEVRQDLLGDAAGIARVADLLAGVLPAALARMEQG